MAKHIPQEYYLSGSNVLNIASSFLYEISLYKIYKDRAECIQTKYISSKNPLKIKRNSSHKNELDYILMQTIDWIAAPINYIKENKLKKVLI